MTAAGVALVSYYPPCRHGCSCSRHEGYGCLGRKPEGGFEWNIHPECAYHAQSAENPLNHRNPWNCPTYWNGCNCVGGPLYSDEMHALALMLRTAHGYPWRTRYDYDDDTVHMPSDVGVDA